MQGLKLIVTVWSATAVFSAAALMSGCGVNEARHETVSAVAPVSDSIVAAPVAVPQAPVPDPVVVPRVEPEPVEPGQAPALEPTEAGPDAAEVAAREQAVAAKEAELERAQQRLDDRIRALTARLDHIEDRELELDRREMTTDRAEPDPGEENFISTPVRVVNIRLPQSTALAVELEDEVSTESSRVGDPIRARVLNPVVRDGLVVVPTGSIVTGSVADVVSSRKIGGQARVAVRFDALELIDGQLVPIESWLAAEGRVQRKKDAATIGGSAAGGAVLGRVLGRDRKKGAVVGAVLGAVIGSAVASKNAADPVLLEAGSFAELQLETAVDVAVTVSDGPDAMTANLR